ncbi:MAG: tRNA pseudouridine(55) synthase TruB [Bacteroidetes bacterium GWF2_42_66]|nr:MAG: tRNA pseudouridine(55) synthase TruB [Bacteroidetes bacterium GWA2_42_15]OFX97884.1 MAG: tRNA pseudouridine(55) synthase TruB [Bacteroidetes bacterium GWE2_42_39]OFY44139.1 MAG: tRNA pseudouridine(55) synthase TruB [Bacteroidetes bacterium GWF2_42_66]HAZ03413.1 tRNA pseudouridine(55) synthase TruB [Marinilabiliales bacterium]HBL74616.1 tRNA pseudouridine(55) synthase TruB [Prolixibacteraceae bacterium]
MGESIQDFNFPEGEILLFDKELEWTSFDLVQKVRNNLCRMLGIKKLKVGHAGTLDPKATGLMILCTGKATKQIESLQAEEKEYIATLKLGATTPSFDLETEEEATYETSHITRELVLEALQKFEGKTDQVPPIFSAVKIDGKRAYKHARKGEDVELKSRPIFIREIELQKFSAEEITIRVVCSKGTYIRSLARDLGLKLNSGAYLTGLRRTRIGNFSVESAFSVENFLKILRGNVTN